MMMLWTLPIQCSCVRPNATLANPLYPLQYRHVFRCDTAELFAFADTYAKVAKVDASSGKFIRKIASVPSQLEVVPKLKRVISIILEGADPDKMRAGDGHCIIFRTKAC
eukprot:gnl/TRDRNA2_/TRDRNA2_72738_c1_seq1.p1 gnl/TRDRNA2_/TRDRNA2_72738_c1~~gnl/TRDRNA2_/TRDRNA2_72738_c1_seq1.p1  ORF type:complete len:109 (-),score=4.02 gnl/TRDRNA2_/TRDRNA2_72738_c1_seq1:12-338(-)